MVAKTESGTTGLVLPITMRVSSSGDVRKYIGSERNTSQAFSMLTTLLGDPQ